MGLKNWKLSASALAVEGQLEAVRLTQSSAGWLLEIAESSSHPDAAAACRWLEHVGQRSYDFSVESSALVASVLDGSSHAH
jgi:hypothetical protein